MKPTNIAIASGLTHDSLEQTIIKAASAQRGMGITLAWGQKSEISPDIRLQLINQELRHNLGLHRYQGIRIPRMRHADGDDINLHAAIMLQGLVNK